MQSDPTVCMNYLHWHLDFRNQAQNIYLKMKQLQVKMGNMHLISFSGKPDGNKIDGQWFKM